ncbi:5'-3' exonuclease PLD3 isoform X1 [Ixodes scapularis]|uniref:5'-3' exonuclease PLD3 isoform X1 n=1 Tax=Ixodes scapularis TaxID=6945 RepID=UPI001A9D0F01|nr:5'-3' exonuclease PLD3 isoform X1 [Ixodes scapularis]
MRVSLKGPYVVQVDDDEGRAKSLASGQQLIKDGKIGTSTSEAVPTKMQRLKKTVLDSAGKLDFGEFELQLFDNRYMNNKHQPKPDMKLGGWFRPSCIPISVILVLIVLVVLFPLLGHSRDQSASHGAFSKCKQSCTPFDCLDSCSFTLVESIPENLTYPDGLPEHVSTFEAWKTLLEKAEKEILIASFYWTLRGSDLNDTFPSAWQGEEIFNKILEAGTERGIKIKIAQNLPSLQQPNYDTEELARKGAAVVRSLNFTRLQGAGVLHTKFWIVDGKHIYLGSANMDWRSLTQVKELGALVLDCECLAADLMKVFEVYWTLGVPDATVPAHWPANLSTQINALTPARLSLNGTQTLAYFSSSPPSFSPDGRTQDIDSILDVIASAKKYIHIAVMDYYPVMLYGKNKTFWPRIDDALKAAAVERNVRVRLLVSKWTSTRGYMFSFLRSLAAVSYNSKYYRPSIEVKYFVVPTFTPEQEKVPYARVNHNKYMVTDNKAYIGTSNWSPDYFINTGGVGLIMDQSHNSSSPSQPIREQLESVFERDWHSEYADPL